MSDNAFTTISTVIPIQRDVLHKLHKVKAGTVHTFPPMLRWHFVVDGRQGRKIAFGNHAVVLLYNDFHDRR